jgi:hypothetical protein
MAENAENRLNFTNCRPVVQVFTRSGSEDDIRRESEFLFRCYSDPIIWGDACLVAVIEVFVHLPGMPEDG